MSHHNKKQVSHRLSACARELLARLADVRGVSATAILEQMIRKEANREGITTLKTKGAK